MFQILPSTPPSPCRSDTVRQCRRFSTIQWDTVRKVTAFSTACRSPCSPDTACQDRGLNTVRHGTTQQDSVQCSHTAVGLSRLAYLHVLQTLNGKASQRIQYDTMGYSTTDHSRRLQLFFQGLHLSMYLRRCKTKQTRGFSSIQRGTLQHTTAGSCSSRVWTSQSCIQILQNKAGGSKGYKEIQYNTPQ